MIVPIYNVEKYLRQCLDSIIAQTLKDIEIILVNDGSTDNCGVICDEYALKDKRIQVIHKTNAGLGAAYNTGLEMASGEYIGFVESDDWIEPNMYEELYAKAKETDVDVCLSGYFLNNNQSTKKELQLLESIDDSIFNILNYPQLLM
ncbi:glycosyltransferase, partial [Campylobacter coli]|nr:glycosyltransferase [Campylobacter coli]